MYLALDLKIVILVKPAMNNTPSKRTWNESAEHNKPRKWDNGHTKMLVHQIIIGTPKALILTQSFFWHPPHQSTDTTLPRMPCCQRYFTKLRKGSYFGSNWWVAVIRWDFEFMLSSFWHATVKGAMMEEAEGGLEQSIMSQTPIFFVMSSGQTISAAGERTINGRTSSLSPRQVMVSVTVTVSRSMLFLSEAIDCV